VPVNLGHAPLGPDCNWTVAESTTVELSQRPPQGRKARLDSLVSKKRKRQLAGFDKGSNIGMG
jgi:hypothetical protein